MNHYIHTTDEFGHFAVLLIRPDGSTKLLRYWASPDGVPSEGEGGKVLRVTVGPITRESREAYRDDE